MDGEELRQRMLERYEINLEPEMSGYVMRKLGQVGGATSPRHFPVIGGNARTGVPMRTLVDPDRLTQ